MMTIHFTCPHCAAQTGVSEEYAGQTGPCAQCGQTVTIPPLQAGPAPGPPKKSSSGPTVAIIVVAVMGAFLICGGILVALLLPAIQAAREAARRAQCMNNLKQIGIAMQIYNEQYGSFPPAYLADEDGKPMHSWRVLILPFLEQQHLYDMYDFDEPWDSPNNLMVADMMVPLFTCPSYGGTDLTETNYVMIVGPGTISDGASATKMMDVQDGTSNTIMVVEVAGSGIKWAEPRDLDAQQIAFAINAGGGSDISSRHPGGVNVVMCDGSAHFLDESIGPEEIRAMSTIGGGEPAGPIW